MKNRNVKVYGMPGYKYRETPTIMLKGNWLMETGFNAGDFITVEHGVARGGVMLWERLY